MLGDWLDTTDLINTSTLGSGDNYSRSPAAFSACSWFG
jgi:hypothetical protein